MSGILFLSCKRETHVSSSLTLYRGMCSACTTKATLRSYEESTLVQSAMPPPPPLAVAISSSALIQLKNAFLPFSAFFTLLSDPNPVEAPIYRFICCGNKCIRQCCRELGYKIIRDFQPISHCSPCKISQMLQASFLQYNTSMRCDTPH